MAEPSTIARPYADAAFRLADAQGKLAEWSTALANQPEPLVVGVVFQVPFSSKRRIAPVPSSPPTVSNEPFHL